MRSRRHILGQNFLHHKPTIEKIASLVDARIDTAAQEGRPSRLLLEIGPGKLALTNALARVASERKLPMALVERDRFLEDEIRQGMPDADFRLMDAASDALPEYLDELAAANKTPIFVASNLPYSASSQILANLCHKSHLLSGLVVMVQKELAERMVAEPGTGDRGAFSLLIQSYFELTWAFDVGPGAFNPPPKVTSTVLGLTPLAKPMTAELRHPKKFEHFCKMLFSQRRKMVRNLVPNEKHEFFPKLGISGTERPETLKLTTVLELYKLVATDQEEI